MHRLYIFLKQSLFVIISCPPPYGKAKEVEVMEKLDIAIIVFALLLCASLLFASFGMEVLQTASWGLSFP